MGLRSNYPKNRYEDNFGSSGTGATQSGQIEATGGTLTVAGEYTIHTFDYPGSYPNLSWFSVAAAPDNATCDVLVVGGGGGGGHHRGAGGGGGGVNSNMPGFPGPRAGNVIPIGVGDYPIIIGKGGDAPTGYGVNGNDSIFNDGGVNGGTSYSGVGGGGGAGDPSNDGGHWNGNPGGSGGGGRDNTSSAGTGNGGQSDAANGQVGYDGGDASAAYGGGGGGGAGSVGETIPGPQTGGNGVEVSITGSPVYYGAGGGGGNHDGTPRAGGTGGGGASGTPTSAGTAGTNGRGAGGGGGGEYTVGGVGGHGTIIIRYRTK